MQTWDACHRGVTRGPVTSSLATACPSTMAVSPELCASSRRMVRKLFPPTAAISTGTGVAWA
eukprot:429585-Rhodomonas_salina.2